MLPTLKRADADRAYFMTDSSSWVTAKADLPNLVVLFRGDPDLVNVYHALCQSTGATPEQPYARAFVAFLASPAAQSLIRNFGQERYQEPLYKDAEQAKSIARE